jgi:mannosyltransferase
VHARGEYGSMTVHGDVLEQARLTRDAESGGRSVWSPADAAAAALRVAWAWPALVMLVVGCYQVTSPELWRDELSSWSFASRPVPELVAIISHSNASQLTYYLLLHYWIAAFGDSVFAMRSLSVLAMTGAAACVTLVGRRLAGAWAGLLAGLVFALVPSISRFAQETRFYALEVLVAMLATLLLLRAIERPSPRRWVVYALSVAVLGYVDLVALCLLAGHLAGVAIRWWQDRDYRLICFLPAGLAGCLACAPMAIVGLGQASNQIGWIPRPGLSLSAFEFFGRNLFYSTAAAAALIIVAVLAWAVSWRAAAFATSIAIAPVVMVWVVSQGPVSYFFPRYLLLTIGAWAMLAGIALSRLDARVAVAAVLVFGLLGAGDQRVIREPGAHNWAAYPLSVNTAYWDFAGAARIVADGTRPGDGIAYPVSPNRWEMIDFGVEYYLSRDLPAATMPRQVFVARSAAAAGTLYSILCGRPARCLGDAPRVWVVGSGHPRNPWRQLTPGEAAALRPHYRVARIRRVSDLTIFLLTRT